MDEVWWLVSPQNPLKSATGMAPFAERLRCARAVACHPRIRVSDAERRLGTAYTVETLVQLRRRHPNTRFVWMMGADNLIAVHRWYRWRELFALASVAVFDRPGYTYGALRSRAALAFAARRYKGPLKCLASMAPPAWAFVWNLRDASSASALRSR